VIRTADEVFTLSAAAVATKSVAAYDTASETVTAAATATPPAESTLSAAVEGAATGAKPATPHFRDLELIPSGQISHRHRDCHLRWSVSLSVQQAVAGTSLTVYSFLTGAGNVCPTAAPAAESAAPEATATALADIAAPPPAEHDAGRSLHHSPPHQCFSQIAHSRRFDSFPKLLLPRPRSLRTRPLQMRPQCRPRVRPTPPTLFMSRVG
jgi:hypothetical protein